MTEKPLWMVRAGAGGGFFDEFQQQGLVAVGWVEVGSLSNFRTREIFIEAVRRAYPMYKQGAVAITAGQLFRFVQEMRPGDRVLTYNPEARQYLLGTIVGGYSYEPNRLPALPNVRLVQWETEVDRDHLSVSTRNSLGAISTLFLLPPSAASEIERVAQNPGATNSSAAPVTATTEPLAEEAQVDDLYKDAQAKAFEFTKDKVNLLDWEEMQELVAGLLRAMGYKTRISPRGPDQGKDIIASPDGFGFEEPRIIVEVKHRNSAMGAPEIRSFLGGRHERDRGLYVSTGGFSKEARYEAERARIPLTLMDLDDLVNTLLIYYEQMDLDSQRLVPLRKVYWPS